MRARRVPALAGVAALVAGLLAAPPGRQPIASATPVATNAATYEAFGRVFPDPHGCVQGAPNKSPWAKGNVCAAQFVQWDDALEGLRFLEDRFGRYVQVINLRTMFGQHPEFAGEELQSAGLPREDLSREKRDLYVVKVTDRESPIPEPEREHFAYALSIHGIERAGLEGGIRSIEDLVTWTACEEDPSAAPACASDGPFPKPILEPSNSGPTAGEVLDRSVIYFVLANPDGWNRGEWSKAGVFFQRYNGNGMDLNRDWPAIGYTESQYTPFSEPESRGYGRFLRWVRDRTAAGRFAAGIDLHGMLTARSFSFTLLGAGQRDYRKNALTVDTAIRTFRDSEERLSWSPLIAPSEECPGPVQEPVFQGHVPMCSDQWGTVWDTIDYQVTGSMGDWMDSPLGLDAVGIDNEMALSHITPNNIYEPDITQLHIDGNKGLIYSQIASLLEAAPVEFVPGGRTAYIFDPERISNPGGGEADPGLSDLPTQDDIHHTQANGIQEFSFEVKGPEDGVHNGGLTVEATFGNVRGISTNSAADLVLEYCGPPEHPGDPEGECRAVAHYFNQSFIYAQAGARIDLNDPRPGPYRIRPNPGRALPTAFHVSFSPGDAYPTPEQAPYDVSRMDFFDDLNRYAAPGNELVPVSVDEVLADPGVLDAFDSVVVANDFMPGFVAAGTVEEPGEPQPGETFAFGPADAPVPTLDATPLLPEPNGVHEFEVRNGFDNDRLVVTGHWELPSDFDMRVEQLNPDSGEWEARGCECAFVGNGEQVTVFAPDPGQWRVRLENYAGVPQDVEGTIEFVSDPAPPPASESQYTLEEFESYAAALAGYAASGGNVVLTDAALTGLPSLGTGLSEGDVSGGFFYAGWMDFDDGAGPTYDRHPLAAAVDKEGTAEGQGRVDGQTFDNRHQTYEPVPLGYYVSPSGSANDDCSSDRCDSPNWVVDDGAWSGVGGTTAARTLVRATPTPGDESTTGTSLGELAFGEGVIRIAGALLPDPTEGNYHPYGLTSYALTYTGYQVFENLIQWDNPNAELPSEPAPGRSGDHRRDGDRPDAAGGERGGR